MTGPPPPQAIEAMTTIEGVRMFPATINAQAGPDGLLGPESAGAILLLQGTFADMDGFDEFWVKVVELMRLLATAPGFMRRYNFADGPHYTLIAFWRTVEDAHRFFASPEHQAAMRLSFERRWNYTHFAGLWQVDSPHQRLFFCQSCDVVTASTESRCTGCGEALLDPYGDADVPAAHSLS
ncbi:hypothetical protein ISU10_22170 [Nocardioides agariphilus]|uniref:Uncharacterized protein n=1 Tax=Nocardioides agariphilus TaxID=433664 RepID=A0A930YPQ0_9ACTN|nr:hypothetical protein [Nocardioides agariphilus]MBF4770489.1 hypothetical protein [Nocardioides agariphilus]